jgi:hypothetical protein
MEDARRRLDSLVADGAHLTDLRSELERQPPDERADLCRYAWGLLDHRYGSEEESALWLYAWTLEAGLHRGTQTAATLRPLE